MVSRKLPLKPPLRFVFDLAVHRKTDKLIIEAQETGVLTRRGRPMAPALFDDVFVSKGWKF